MNFSYQMYLKQNSTVPAESDEDGTPDSVRWISSCYFAFNKILQLCRHTFDERNDEGQKYLTKTLTMIIAAYQIFSKKKNTSHIHHLESMIRIHELKSFVMEKFIKSTVVEILRLMPDKIEQLVENRKILGGLEIKLSKEIIHYLSGDQRFLKDSEAAILQDLSQTFEKISVINVAQR